MILNEDIRKYAAEFMGTFALVFAGTGAIVINDISGGMVSHAGVALTFGLVVTSVIYAVGDVSGAHLNPAVTFGFWAARRFQGRSVPPYIISQCAGALLASAMLKLLFTGHPTLGAALPAGTIIQSFILEVILTWLLVFVILNVSTGSKEKGSVAGIAVGSAVGLEALFAGPVSGASMNPARSLAPALLSGHLSPVGPYITAHLAGAYLAVLSSLLVRKKDCCGNPCTEDMAGGPYK